MMRFVKGSNGVENSIDPDQTTPSYSEILEKNLNKIKCR